MTRRARPTRLQRGAAVRVALSLLLGFVATPGSVRAQQGASSSTVEESTSAVRHHEVMVEMRDGMKLATSVYLPSGQGPFPTVLQRTPYNRAGGARTHRRYTDAGYAFVIQDHQGRYGSEGEYTPHENELEDGYDTVEWIARQLWSNGRVGVSGTSAVGIAANLAAAANPPHLRAAYVRLAPRSLFLEGRFVGGLFKEADTGNWMRGQGETEEEVAAYKRRVIEDQRWRDTDLIYHRHEIDIPIYNVGGWYDLFSYGNVTNFQYLQEWGRLGAVGNQRLMMGPIGHGRLQGALAYPDPSVATDEELRFFDYWLKGIDNGIMDEPPVRYYMMASAKEGEASAKNGWRTADEWPPSESTRTRYYLQQDGGLSTVSPTVMRSSTSYDFDPADPVPTVGGLNLTLPIGPMDQREVGERSDYLRFETETLAADVVIAGKIDFELCAATDGPDTDFIVKLVDVYPDGYEALVLDTGLRTRYRNGQRTDLVELMTPGEPTRMNVDMWNSAITFEAGHRIAVHVTSSNYPRFDVNPNTGDPPGTSNTEPRVARNTVYHSASCASALVLPVMPG